MLQEKILNSKGREGLICLHPFYFMEFTTDGSVYTCCPSWIKTSIGNIRNNTIEEIWNGDRASYIREQMYAGKWQKICNPICPILSSYRNNRTLIGYSKIEDNDYLTTFLADEIRQGKVHLESAPTVFNLSNSKICNLSCIMCVRDTQKDDTPLMEKTITDVMGHLPSARRIIMSGMGDPFARPDTRELLINFRGDNPDLKIELITNALLLPKYWERVKHQRFDTLLISVDAAKKETYEKIRRGGKWENLLESLQLVNNNKDRFSGITINMTVMRENYREIPAFIDLAESHGFNVSFQRIRGTWGKQNIFELNDSEAVSELKEIIAKESIRKRSISVFWGDLVELVQEGCCIPHEAEKETGANEPIAGGSNTDGDAGGRHLAEATECPRGADISGSRELPLSVVICTYNRAGLLEMTLDSLLNQTMDRDKYEIVVIDDGSSDDTKKCVESFAGRLPLRYFYQKNSGLAAAKNHGIFAAGGEILFFMDDDDIAAPMLLEEHLRTHSRYPDDNYAVLNYTTWAPDLTVTPLMHFIAEVGCFLFYYPYIKNGEVLDYTYFWGGRSSCKRAFLIDHGVFNPLFRFGCEDIELGYRLSMHGLRVVYNHKALSYMVRPVGFDDFCNRLIKQGRSQYVFSSLHDDPAVYQWAEMKDAEEKWGRIRDVYDAKRNSARGLDRIANAKLQLNLGLDDTTKRLLHDAYWWVFRASKVKGIIEAAEETPGKEKPGESEKCREKAMWGSS